MKINVICTVGPSNMCINFEKKILWPVEPSWTDKQTNAQTNRQTDYGDQYTLQKSTILQSNKQNYYNNLALQD